ncbi:Toxin ParE4 [Novosphingobium sp. CECT 9465]|nr:type II toxin-antitoxin system RelE/ParE family toxin [Novosphingobium sp. CECT 9465]CAH0495192.1 Toxin ParE4 [Novosphingobium sp. CECT 9465]
MVEVRFSIASENDLADIDTYSMSEFGSAVAAAYMHSFTSAFQKLRDFPKAGRAMPELGRGVRYLSHRQHGIIYKLTRDDLLIVRIVHHAMDAQSAVKQAKHDR